MNSGHSAYSSAASTFICNYLGSNVFGKSVTLKDNDSRFDPNGFDGQPGTTGYCDHAVLGLPQWCR
jgi:hypothetical protein